MKTWRRLVAHVTSNARHDESRTNETANGFGDEIARWMGERQPRRRVRKPERREDPPVPRLDGKTELSRALIPIHVETHEPRERLPSMEPDRRAQVRQVA
jgi:hypothetical protein